MPERYLGKTLGKYRVQELVGSGGFAWVYRGFDPELDIPVALKVLKPQFAGDPTFEERFRREATTAAKLRHPNIIKIYTVGRDGDAVYFAMDFLPSGLADKLEHTATLPEEFVIRVGIDVARALGFAHREGVIHRDIKVDNILFDPHGNAVVADFGIARAVTGYANQTGTNMVVGTPQYFAPEQARAKPLDGRADIYSLGVSLFRSTTGRLPFEGDDWYEIARQHVEEAPPAPRSIVPTLSPAFEQVVLRCLAKHPDDRPATGEQLADELAAVLNASHSPAAGRANYLSPTESPTLVTPVAASLRARRFWRRSVPIALLVLVSGAIAITTLLRRADSSAALPPATRADSIAAGLVPDSSALAVAESVAVDTAGAADTTRRTIEGTPAARDSTRPRPAPLGRLVVNAPPNARVSVNGQVVSEGAWSSDSLRPGEYALGATIPAASGCESASIETRVRVRAGASESVTLAPRPCGSIMIVMRNVAPSGARYSIVSTDGTIRREGSLPLPAPVVLPVGEYRLSAQQPLCAPYSDDAVAVTADRVTQRSFSVICERE